MFYINRLSKYNHNIINNNFNFKYYNTCYNFIDYKEIIKESNKKYIKKILENHLNNEYQKNKKINFIKIISSYLNDNTLDDDYIE